MIDRAYLREFKRRARHQRIRRKITGTPERPRLVVHRSHQNFFAQLVDDSQGRVICGLSTLNPDVKKSVGKGSNKEAARALGLAFGRILKDKGFGKVSFDRGGYLYHGRVAAFAEGVREAGVEF